jgi:hypothetical protein
MRDLSMQADIPFVAYLLNMVSEEAGEARKGLSTGSND